MISSQMKRTIIFVAALGIAVVRLDNADPVSGRPMSAVTYDVDLEVTDGVGMTSR